MKTKLLTLLAIVALPLASVNCGKTETSGGTEPEPVPEENVSLSLSSGIASKTVLGELNGDAYPVYWCEGDRIAVNGKRSEPLHEIGAKTVKATFNVDGVNAPYGVVYPSWICDAMDSEKAEITLQTIQKWTPGSFSNGAAVLYGQSSDKEFELKNLCGVVRIAMDFGKNKIAGIVLNSLSAPISGKFGLNLGTGELSAIDADNRIEISVPDAGFSTGSKKAAELNFCVPAGEYPDGFNITLTDSYNRQMVIEIRENTRIPAGVVVDWGKQTFVPAGALIITDPESWNTFADAVNAGDYSDWVDPETGEVNVASNIVNAGDLTQIESWNGVFNGGGYTITRNAIHKPLFKKIAEGAVVKNLKLDGLRNEPGDNSCAVLAGTNLGTIENCESKSKLTVTVDANFHFCGLVEANAGAMKSCTNSADFEINLPFTGNHELIGGGLAFRPDAESKLGSFEDCKNTGNITILKNAVAASGLHKCAVGGILASAYGGTKDVFVKLKNCSNEGKITLWENEKQKSGDQGAYAVGGIVGRIALLSGNAAAMYVNPTPTAGFIRKSQAAPIPAQSMPAATLPVAHPLPCQARDNYMWAALPESSSALRKPCQDFRMYQYRSRPCRRNIETMCARRRNTRRNRICGNNGLYQCRFIRDDEKHIGTCQCENRSGRRYRRPHPESHACSCALELQIHGGIACGSRGQMLRRNLCYRKQTDNQID